MEQLPADRQLGAVWATCKPKLCFSLASECSNTLLTLSKYFIY